MDLATLESEVKAHLAEFAAHAANVRAKIEALVNEDLAAMHAKAAGISQLVEKAQASPLTADIEAALPPEIAEATKVVLAALAEGSKALSTVHLSTAPEQPAATTPAEAAAPAAPVQA